MDLLKQEINQHGTALLDLAKWKLIAVGAVAVVGLGWSGIVPGGRDLKVPESDALLILYSVGFLCSYIDVLFYQKNTAIHVIASYLRQYSGSNATLQELSLYETYVGVFRRTRGIFFFSYRWPQFAFSLLFTVGLAVLGYIKYGNEENLYLLAVAGVAVILNVALYFLYTKHRAQLISTVKDLA